MIHAYSSRQVLSGDVKTLEVFQLRVDGDTSIQIKLDGLFLNFSCQVDTLAQ